MHITKLLTTSLLTAPNIDKCKTCIYNKNNKCFYYRVILDIFVFDLQDQISNQQFATEKSALDVTRARSDKRLCGPNAKYFEELKSDTNKNK